MKGGSEVEEARLCCVCLEQLSTARPWAVVEQCSHEFW